MESKHLQCSASFPCSPWAHKPDAMACLWSFPLGTQQNKPEFVACYIVGFSLGHDKPSNSHTVTMRWWLADVKMCLLYRSQTHT